VGEHRALGGFYPVLPWEKVISGGFIWDYPKTPEGSIMNTSLTRLVRMVVAPVILGLGVTACTQGASPPPQTLGFTTRTPSQESAPPSSAPTRTAMATTSVPSPAVSASSVKVSASSVAAIGPVWPIEPRRIAAAGSRQGLPVLKAIRTGRHGSYERLVLEFTASFGEANVRYVPVVHSDPSDKVVPLKGLSFLEVVVHGAVAHWPATPITPYAGPSTVTPGYPTLKQVSISGDFEAVLSFGVGLARTAGFQVTRLRSPDRLVVDVAESPTWQRWPDDSLATARVIQTSFDQGHIPWRGSGESVAWSYAFTVYGWNKPVVTPVPGTDVYRLTHQGSPDNVTVRAVREFPAIGRDSIFEITDTR
jgi:hypothetical protein